ncbi:MAG TPA: PepSY domain-containing protein [Xanthobacteraceae bacterium]|nr:PepSY domain-containing protein [Xanthobacteraceae bacterium]
MRFPILTALFTLAASVAFAEGPKCTSAPKSQWLSQDAMKAKIAQGGYTYKVFKVTSGNCYEIYGQDKDGRRVEIYFAPVSGAINVEHKS